MTLMLLALAITLLPVDQEWKWFSFISRAYSAG